jgi:hypothetical protein
MAEILGWLQRLGEEDPAMSQGKRSVGEEPAIAA